MPWERRKRRSLERRAGPAGTRTFWEAPEVVCITLLSQLTWTLWNCKQGLVQAVALKSIPSLDQQEDGGVQLKIWMKTSGEMAAFAKFSAGSVVLFMSVGCLTSVYPAQTPRERREP